MNICQWPNKKESISTPLWILTVQLNVSPLHEHWDHCSVVGIATLRVEDINLLMFNTWLNEETGESRSLPEIMSCFLDCITLNHNYIELKPMIL